MQVFDTELTSWGEARVSLCESRINILLVVADESDGQAARLMGLFLEVEKQAVPSDIDNRRTSELVFSTCRAHFRSVQLLEPPAVR